MRSAVWGRGGNSHPEELRAVRVGCLQIYLWNDFGTAHGFAFGDGPDAGCYARVRRSGQPRHGKRNLRFVGGQGGPMSDAIVLTQPGEAETKRTPTVYFIDDSATMREVIKIAFRREHINVITCADAASALAQFEG